MYWGQDCYIKRHEQSSFPSEISLQSRPERNIIYNLLLGDHDHVGLEMENDFMHSVFTPSN